MLVLSASQSSSSFSLCICVFFSTFILHSHPSQHLILHLSPSLPALFVFASSPHLLCLIPLMHVVAFSSSSSTNSSSLRSCLFIPLCLRYHPSPAHPLYWRLRLIFLFSLHLLFHTAMPVQEGSYCSFQLEYLRKKNVVCIVFCYLMQVLQEMSTGIVKLW